MLNTNGSIVEYLPVYRHVIRLLDMKAKVTKLSRTTVVFKLSDIMSYHATVMANGELLVSNGARVRDVSELKHLQRTEFTDSLVTKTGEGLVFTDEISRNIALWAHHIPFNSYERRLFRCWNKDETKVLMISYDGTVYGIELYPDHHNGVKVAFEKPFNDEQLNEAFNRPCTYATHHTLDDDMKTVLAKLTDRLFT